MTKSDSWKVWGKGISYGLESGTVNVPYVLLANYAKLHLSELEVMLLLQLLAFRQMEQSQFPSIDQLEARMGTAPGELPRVMLRLMKDGWVSIDEDVEGETGLQMERYNLSGMYDKLANLMVEERATARYASTQQEQPASPPKDEQEMNLFIIFEKEFARPLSPMECETISGWVDQDGYPDELILLALKEAVFAGKVHFRYIDRILLEWSRNRVRTAEEAKAYTQKFRGGLR